jgi:hypothetical protein
MCALACNKRGNSHDQWSADDTLQAWNIIMMLQVHGLGFTMNNIRT